MRQPPNSTTKPAIISGLGCERKTFHAVFASRGKVSGGRIGLRLAVSLAAIISRPLMRSASVVIANLVLREHDGPDREAHRLGHFVQAAHLRDVIAARFLAAAEHEPAHLAEARREGRDRRAGTRRIDLRLARIALAVE